MDIFFVDIFVTLQDDFHFICHFRLCFFYCEILFVIYVLHLSLFGQKTGSLMHLVFESLCFLSMKYIIIVFLIHF